MTETAVETPDTASEEEAPVESFTSETSAPRPTSNIEAASAIGRRKEAIARVRAVPGSGAWKINGRSLEEYFPNKVHQQLVKSPLVELNLAGSYDIHARITGGGASGQAGALRLGIARSLNKADIDNNRAALKKAGFLTRDARVVERKKAGLKKARKAQQYSKR
jgi:small subunit ribosomal protein S9